MKFLRKSICIKDLPKRFGAVEWLLFAVLAGQFAMTLYFNLVHLDTHMGFDSSWAYLKAVLMWNEKKLISPFWSEQTSVFWDSSLPLASLIYGVTGKRFASYGLSNIIVLSGLIWCMYSLCKDFGFELRIRLICLNLMLCPYMVNGFSSGNDLGYFSNLLSGAAFYNVRTLLCLMIIKAFLDLTRQKSSKLLIAVSLPLCFIAGISSGIFMLIILLVPCLAFIAVKVLISNSFAEAGKKPSLYVYSCIALVLAGKLFSQYVLHLSAMDTAKTWTSIENIWSNFGAVFQGLMILLGVLPTTDTSVEILSPEGLYQLFPLAIFVVVIAAAAFCFLNTIKCLKNKLAVDDPVFLCCTVLVCNVLIFGLFNAQYGLPIFEDRYLICPFMLMILMTGCFLRRLDKKQIVTCVVWGMLIIGLIGTNAVSDSEYIQTTNESWELENIRQVVEQSDAEVVYLWGESLNCAGRSMRIYDLDHVYKCITNEGGFQHWGDYTYYDDNEDYSGPTLLITSNWEDLVPDYIMSQYTLLREMTFINIYKCNDNPIDFNSGITGDVSIDYPYTPGMFAQNGHYAGDVFVSDGTEGIALWGPYCPTVEGTYSFTVHYSYSEGSTGAAAFDIALDNGTSLLGEAQLPPDSNAATISDIVLEDGHTLEYRIKCDEGALAEIEKIVITRQDAA